MSTNIQEQIERRHERAREEILKIANKGSHPIFSQFEVKSVSGRVYRVEIRSLDEMHNSCACPDYKTNLIGTCKHIEGVLIYLKEEHGDRLEKLASLLVLASSPPAAAGEKATPPHIAFERESVYSIGRCPPG